MRKLGACAGLGMALACAAALAASSVPGNATENDLKEAAAYQPLAAALGADTLAHAVVADQKTLTTFEFLPKGELLTGWTRIVTISVAPAADPEALNRSIDAMQQIVSKQGALESFNIIPDNKKRPAALFCYSLGAGPDAEHTCGIIGEFAAGSVTSFQLQRRGAAIEAADKAKLKDMLPVYF